MNRRQTLKTLFLAPLSGAVIASSGCFSATLKNRSSSINWTRLPTEYSYGRTKAEMMVDQSLFAEIYFRESELITIAVLCDIILPNDHPNGGALDAGLPDFVEFMVKDRAQHKLQARGGIAWLNSYAIDRFGSDFLAITEAERLQICDDIAYPEETDPKLQTGIKFFALMRDLTLTGYYTTELGFRDLGYEGNTPNIWDGVPDEVLRRHGKSYDLEWLSKCIDQPTRNVLAEWDDDMNLIS